MKNILMNTEMTKAILDGRKVQTRGPVKSDEVFIKNLMINLNDGYSFEKFIDSEAKYKIGETIWVREPARITGHSRVGSRSEGDYKEMIWFKYLADKKADFMHLPERFVITPEWVENCQGIPNGCIKEMARIFLKITDVRIERLQDITPEDTGEPDFCYEWWIDTWDETAPKGYKWRNNPYVFVYEFGRVEK